MNKFEFVEMIISLRKKFKSAKSWARYEIDEHLRAVKENECELNKTYIEVLKTCSKWSDVEEIYINFII